MSDIIGSGYGSAHDWQRRETSHFKSTEYRCRRCPAGFLHHYDVRPDIFVAMRHADVPEVCVGSAHRGAPEPSTYDRAKNLGPLPDELMPDREWTDLEWVRNQWYLANQECEALEAELRAARVGGIAPAPCPYVRTSAEGTSYCTLAERVAPAPAPEPHMLDLSRIKYDEEWQMLAGMHASELRAALKMLARAQAEGEA